MKIMLLTLLFSAVGVTALIGILRNLDDDAEDNVDQKMNLYFTYESRDTQKSFDLFITVKLSRS